MSTQPSHAVDPILEKYGLTLRNFDPDKWYPLQLFYDVSYEATKEGGKEVETALGKAIAQDVIDIFKVKDIETFITKDLNRIAVSAIRNVPDDFGYIVNKLGKQHYHVKINLPTPDYTVYGWMWETIRLLKKPNENFTITPGKHFGQSRTPGDFEIQWG